MTPWLSVVGLGEDGLEGLSPAARALVNGAEVLVGGARHLAKLPLDGRERLSWPRPLTALLDTLAQRRGRRTCVLATGDPMWYGVGVTLAKRFTLEETVIVPAPSAFSLACARLGWPLTEVETLTLHGRPLETLHPYLQPDAKLVLLSDDGETPAKVAEVLVARGYGDSRLVVLEHMGGPKERAEIGRAADWGSRRVADLNTVAVDCVAGHDAVLLSRMPGLPDEAFRNDGQLTKREIRAATLAALAPVPGQLLWDVGAGCGSVAIEWMRAAPRGRAVAVERNRDRIALIAANATALGTPGLDVVEGDAPAALSGLDPPDAVFIGGGAASDGVFETCWEALKGGGRLVANVVTLEGEQSLAAWRGRAGGELCRIAVARAAAVGPFTGWRPLMPVTQFAAVKR